MRAVTLFVVLAKRVFIASAPASVVLVAPPHAPMHGVSSAVHSSGDHPDSSSLPPGMGPIGDQLTLVCYHLEQEGHVRSPQDGTNGRSFHPGVNTY